MSETQRIHRPARIASQAAALLIVLLIVLVAACKQGPEPTTPGAGGGSRGHTNGTCSPSSVARGTACASRRVPPGDGSSPEDCKSDADCKDGKDGRCVKTGYATQLHRDVVSRSSNLLAGPPAAPHRSTCAYDQCQTDTDCGAKARCECRSGVGTDRNGCSPLDACLSDRECAEDTLCLCGSSASANYCTAGNCRSDADCGRGSSCAGPEGGSRYCRTPRDTCTSDTDCKGDPSGGFSSCSYLSEKHAWGCRLVPPVPAG